MFIIIPAKDVAKVAGATEDGCALWPVQIKDGSYILPVEVLTDEAHKTKWKALSAYPVRTLLDSDFVGGE